jgi:hypothetical protein
MAVATEDVGKRVHCGPSAARTAPSCATDREGQQHAVSRSNRGVPALQPLSYAGIDPASSGAQMFALDQARVDPDRAPTTVGRMTSGEPTSMQLAAATLEPPSRRG